MENHVVNTCYDHKLLIIFKAIFYEMSNSFKLVIPGTP